MELETLGASAGGRCLSWSPKGKQLAVGGRGCIVRYRPDLKEAGRLTLDPSGRMCGLLWLSTSQFLCALVHKDDGCRLDAFLVFPFETPALVGFLFVELIAPYSKLNRFDDSSASGGRKWRRRGAEAAPLRRRRPENGTAAAHRLRRRLLRIVCPTTSLVRARLLFQ